MFSGKRTTACMCRTMTNKFCLIAEGESIMKMNLMKIEMVCKLQVQKATARILHNEEDMLDKVCFALLVFP